MRNFFIFLIVLFLKFSIASSQTLQWAKQFGGAQPDAALNLLEFFQIQQKILNPKRRALAYCSKLSRLEMREAERRLVLPSQGEIPQAREHGDRLGAKADGTVENAAGDLLGLVNIDFASEYCLAGYQPADAAGQEQHFVYSDDYRLTGDAGYQPGSGHCPG